MRKTTTDNKTWNTNRQRNILRSVDTMAIEEKFTNAMLLSFFTRFLSEIDHFLFAPVDCCANESATEPTVIYV